MRAALAVGGSAVATLVAAELVMRPEMGTRLAMARYLGGVAAASVLVVWLVPRWAARRGGLRHTVLVAALVSLVVVVGSVAAAAALMFISPHDLHLLWIVLGFSALTGVTVAGAVGRGLTTDLKDIAAAARAVGEGDLTVRTGVVRSDEVGEVARALDITADRLAALEAERAREHAARRAFLRAIGHDLRTPLAALRAALEAVQDGVVDDPRRYLDSMQGDVAALGALVDDLGVLTRIESGRLDVGAALVDLSDLADEALETLRPVADLRGVELVLRARGHVEVVGGPAELSRVIRNLVDNAIRHSPPEGRVVVQIEENGSAEVSVTDDGPGFEPRFLSDAFESFTRGDAARARAGGGSGLGLAIARGFVEAHGGTIWAEPGPGGRVGFRLPRAAAAG